MADAIARLDLAENAPPADGQGPPGDDLNTTPERTPLGRLLIDAGSITDEQLEEALREGAATGERLGEVVVRRQWASEEEVAKLLAEQWQLGYVDRASIWFDADALSRMSREQAQRLEALPTRVQDGRVVVAVAEPTEQRLADLREVIGDDTVVVVVPKTALDAGLRSELLKTDEPGAPVPAERPEPPAQIAVPPPTAPLGDAPPDLAKVLRTIEEAAAEAAALKKRVGNLSRQLEQIAGVLASATAQLGGAAADHERMKLLEEQLAQRTELTERLRSQLSDVSRTLANLD